MTSRDAVPDTSPTQVSPLVQSPISDPGAFEMFASPTSFSPSSAFYPPKSSTRRRQSDGSFLAQPGRGVPRTETTSSFSTSPGQRPFAGPLQTHGISRKPVQSFASGSLSNGPQPSRQPTAHPVPIPGSSQSRNLYSPRSSSQQLSPPADTRTRHSSVSTTHSRTFSISSDKSSALSNTSSSGSDAPTVTVTTGGNTTGMLHVAPTKPMLVLFTQNTKTNRLSLVAFPLDEETSVNPGLCFCSRSGREGASCRIASLQRREGKEELRARRVESVSGDADWNIARLARGWRDDKSGNGEWKGVTRISIEFPDANARAHFAGTPNLCGCKPRLESELKRCIDQGHRGLIGEVQERYRRDAIKHHKARAQAQHVVVNGLPGMGNMS